MKNIALLATFLFFIICFPTLSSYAQTADTFLSMKNQAIEEYKAGRFNTSYEMFMKLLRQSPLDGDINLGVARAAYGAKRYNQAIMAYERLIESYPDKVFLYIEMGRTYLWLGDTKQAYTYFKSAQKLDPTIKDSDIDNLLKRAKQMQRRFFVDGSVSVAALYDSNANSGPLSQSIVLGQWNLLLADEATKKESFGFTGSGALNFTWRQSPESRLLYVADVSVFGKLYTENAVKDNNFLWGRVAAGVRYGWKFGYADLRLKTDFAQYPSDKNITSAGGEGTVVLVPLQFLNFTTRLAYDYRFYQGSIGNDGGVISIAENIRFSVFNQSLIFGGKFISRNADHDRYSSDGVETSLRALVVIPFDFRIMPSVAYKWDWYKGAATALELDNRKDEQIRAGISITKFFPYSISTDLEYMYINNKSNSDLYDYEQQTVTLSVSWYF